MHYPKAAISVLLLIEMLDVDLLDSFDINKNNKNEIDFVIIVVTNYFILLQFIISIHLCSVRLTFLFKISIISKNFD